MADARRFPRLEVPFALVGAVGGFLSASLLSNPLVYLLPRSKAWVVMAAATLFAALAGFVIRRTCVGKREPYALDEPDPSVRPSSDVALTHVIVLFVAGALAGVVSGATCTTEDGALRGGIGGFVCAAVFVPVALAVIAAARRAQRARLGTLVANMDRRAVWSILATTLGVTTLEAPGDAIVIALVAGVVILAAAYADERARSRALSALVDLAESDEEGTASVAIDLGLGDALGAHIARGRTAYRDRDRVLHLVRGDAALVRAAFSRARLRAVAAMLVIACVGVAHALAA